MDENERQNGEDLLRTANELSRSFAANSMAQQALGRRMAEAGREEEKQQKSTRQRLKGFDTALFGAENNLRDFTSSGDGAIQFLNRFASNGRGFIGLGLFTILASQGNQLSKSWQDLTNVGQTFGGNMFTMLQKAGEAGLSLEEFANISKKNNLVIRATRGGFFGMQKELRRAVSAHGSYGFTVEQMNDFLGSNMEVSRRNGSLQSRSSQQVVSDMGDLMNTTTALASASDKTRDEILGLASAAMSSSLSIAQISNTPMAIRGIVDKSVREATLGFAALPGEAGQFFSQFFNDALGASAALTDQGQTLINAGMGGLASEMDAMAGKFRAGQGQGIDEQIYYQDKIIEAYKNNLPMLQAQAAAGNESAKQFIQMASGLAQMTKAELAQKRAANENTETMTAFFSSLNSMFGILKGTFFANFVKGLEGVFGKMDAFGDSAVFKDIERVLGEIGLAWGSSIGKMIKNFDAEKMGDMIRGFMQGIVGLADALVVISKFIGGIAAGLSWVAGMLVGVFGDSLGSVVKWGTILVLGGMAVVKMLKGLLLLKNLFGGMMNIKANVVNVDGPGGGGGGRGRRGGRRSRTRRLQARTRGAGRRVGGAARGIGRAGLGAFGKVSDVMGRMGGGKLAGLGGLAGALYSSMDYMTGEKELTLKNLAKSGLVAGGGALGALAGGGIFSLATGAIGGTLGSMAGDAIFGPDDVAGLSSPTTPKPSAPTPTEAPKTAAAMAGLGAAAAASGATAKPLGPDPMQVLLEESKRQTTIMTDLVETLSGKLEQANRLLSKIEVSTQGIN